MRAQHPCVGSITIRPCAVRPALRSALALRSLVPVGAGHPFCWFSGVDIEVDRGVNLMGLFSQNVKKGDVHQGRSRERDYLLQGI